MLGACRLSSRVPCRSLLGNAALFREPVTNLALRSRVRVAILSAFSSSGLHGEKDMPKSPVNSDDVKLEVIRGAHGSNTVYWYRRPDAEVVVVFFVGDQLQDSHMPSDVLQYQDPKWQATNMAKKFANSSVMVVMPPRLEACYACYDHFLNKTTQSGEPLGYNGSTFKASSQMRSLLSAYELDRLPCHLVGFSKGGVVLNQVLAELAAYADRLGQGVMELSGGPQSGKGGRGSEPLTPAGEAFLRRIRELHFLDVGLNSRGAYITDPQVAHSIAKLGSGALPHIFLHGTPRQWGEQLIPLQKLQRMRDDANRPWIAAEKDRCKAAFEQAGVPVVEHKYFGNEGVRSGYDGLLQHFRVIEAMNPSPSEQGNNS